MSAQGWSFDTTLRLSVDLLRAVVLGLEEGWPAMRKRHGWRPPADTEALLAAMKAELHRREAGGTVPDDDVDYITAAEAARRAGVSDTAVREWWHEGKVQGCKVGHRVLVDADDVDDMIARRSIVTRATSRNHHEP